MSLRAVIFHPLTVLFLSAFGAFLYALYAAWHFSGDKLYGQYFYVVPIVVPFVAFICDRAERFAQLKLTQIGVDTLVMITTMWRVIGDVPYVPGHALFLTYAALTSRSKVARITAALVMLQVIYLKYFVRHDWITPTSGIILGALAAFVTWQINQTNEHRVTS